LPALHLVDQVAVGQQHEGQRTRPMPARWGGTAATDLVRMFDKL